MSFVLDLKNTVPARILCFLPRGLQMYLTRLRLPSFIRLLADGYLPAAVWSSNLASIAAKYSQAPLSMYPSSSRLKNLPEQAISIRKAWDVERESVPRQIFGRANRSRGHGKHATSYPHQVHLPG